MCLEGGGIMREELVTFKGNKDGISVIINQYKSYAEIKERIKNKFESAGDFFNGTKLKIRFQGREFEETERDEIVTLVAEMLGKDADIEFDVRTVKEEALELNNGMTDFHRGTIRSGQILKGEGHLVVFGDINPGAEVIAKGNIIVMGSLRGTVHAGCEGNRDAIIAALNLQPTQLRIADIISRSPDDDEKVDFMPEIAAIKDDHIYIDYYLPKRTDR